MGIPRFGTLINSLNLQGETPEKVSGMLIDLNDLIHFFSQKTYLYGDDFKAFATPKDYKLRDSKSDSELEELFITSLINRLEMYLEVMEPSDYFIVAVDGPVPLAKIAQQRIRRFGAGSKRSTERFDNSSLSPGTPIMESIHLRLEKWFKDKASKDLFPPFACYSSYHEPGEGEHKMIKILLRNNKKIPKSDGVHFICGQDYDLMMLGTLFPFSNVIHYREDRKFEAKNGVPSADIYNVDLFKRYVYRSFMRDRSEIDFVLMYFMFGNDFIPKNPALENATNALKDMATTYILNGKRLVDLKTGKIIRQNFIELFRFFADIEKDNFDTIAAGYNPEKQSPYPILTKNMTKSKSGRIQLNIDKFKLEWYNRAMKMYNETNEDLPQYTDLEVFKRDMFENYLQILQWNLDYYLQRDVAWNFQYKFYFAPLLSDLADLEPSGEILRITDTWSEKSSIIRQLLMITHPSKVEDYIPKNYHNIISLPAMRKVSPTSPVVFMDGKPKNSEHLHVKILPLVDHQYYEDIMTPFKRKIEPRFYVNNRFPDIYVRETPEIKIEDVTENDYLPGSKTLVMSSEKFIWTDDIIR